MQDLTIEQLQEGIIAITQNASELVDEADILLRAGKAARAYGLAYFACEELGKLAHLIGAIERLLVDQNPDWNAIRKAFRHHDSKALNTFISQEASVRILAGAEGDQIQPTLAIGHLIGAAQEVLRSFTKIRRREEAFYVDIGGGKFRRPTDLIVGKDALDLIAVARTQVENAKQRYSQRTVPDILADYRASMVRRRQALECWASLLEGFTPEQWQALYQESGSPISIEEVRQGLSNLKTLFRKLLDDTEVPS